MNKNDYEILVMGCSDKALIENLDIVLEQIRDFPDSIQRLTGLESIAVSNITAQQFCRGILQNPPRPTPEIKR